MHHGAYGAVYPILIAPAWRLFGSVPDAYAAAKTIGSVLMSLTAIPVYFLARRVLTPLPSLLAAFLAVAVPSLMYTGTLMTETVFYPLFACVALVLVLALERPTLLRQLLLLGLCLLAFLTRTQAIVLIPAVATAPLLLAWLDRRAPGAHRPTGAAVTVDLNRVLATIRVPPVSGGNTVSYSWRRGSTLDSLTSTSRWHRSRRCCC